MDEKSIINNRGRRLPDWVRGGLPNTARGGAVRGAVASGRLHTVCESARCPNRGACWDAGEVTFLILGNCCTRNCAYCSVPHGRPAAPDADEPARVLDAVRALGCRYVVITSVTRDDLHDGGAAQFADVVVKLRNGIPEIGVELLVPDFGGCQEAIEIAAAAAPDVFSHNVEVVPRLFQAARPQGNYDRSLELLRIVKYSFPGQITKSGLMAGLGETRGEILEVFADLLNAGVNIVTVGQYLQPARDCAPVDRFLHPDEFRDLERAALDMGFAAAVCGPLVRSSYRAAEAARMAREALASCQTDFAIVEGNFGTTDEHG